MTPHTTAIFLKSVLYGSGITLLLSLIVLLLAIVATASGIPLLHTHKGMMLDLAGDLFLDGLLLFLGSGILITLAGGGSAIA